MRPRWFHGWWLLLLLPMGAGFARLHFEADVLSLLPADMPAVQGQRQDSHGQGEMPDLQR